MSSRNHASDFENLIATLSIVTIVVIVGMIASMAQDIEKSAAVAAQRSQATSKLAQLSREQHHELNIRFDQAVSLLHAKRYDFAAVALDRVLELAPDMPEAHVNMGFALLGMKQYETAAKHFDHATVLRPEQANAYWGLGEALEAMEDYEGALGAMRAYIHLTTPDDPFVAKARAALWELESQLGRVPGVERAAVGASDKDQAEQGPQTKHGQFEFRDSE